MDTIIIRKETKGKSKQLNESAKTLFQVLNENSFKNLSAIISVYVNNWTVLKPELEKRYETKGLKTNDEKKKFLMSIIKENCPFVNAEKQICKAKVTKKEDKTEIIYSVLKSGDFIPKQVHNWIMKGSKKQETIICDVVYNKVVELTIQSTEIKTEKIVLANAV